MQPGSSLRASRDAAGSIFIALPYGIGLLPSVLPRRRGRALLRHRQPRRALAHLKRDAHPGRAGSSLPREIRNTCLIVVSVRSLSLRTASATSDFRDDDRPGSQTVV
jgi:hypothetical protein